MTFYIQKIIYQITKMARSLCVCSIFLGSEIESQATSPTSNKANQRKSSIDAETARKPHGCRAVEWWAQVTSLNSQDWRQFSASDNIVDVEDVTHRRKPVWWRPGQAELRPEGGPKSRVPSEDVVTWQYSHWRPATSPGVLLDLFKMRGHFTIMKLGVADEGSGGPIRW